MENMMACKIRINGKEIGNGNPVYVIAEIGINHNGQPKTARQLIDRARWANASAVKFQTYITEKRVGKNSPIFNLLKQCELTFQEQKELFQYAGDSGIDVFSTPFDDESVDFLASVGTPCYKIASFDVTNRKLVRRISKQGKPVIMSRGMANRQEIDRATRILKKNDIRFALLHCISAYPVSSMSQLHLSTIQALRGRYNCPVGFSDHTIGIEAPKYAVAAGATIIEKHFTLSKKSKGPDHAISAEPAEMKKLTESIRFVREIMGTPAWAETDAEKEILQYRRYS
jgi:sialic acid synthase SpsE